MRAEIKAIECPKCGNTSKAQLRPGDFRCEACGTEYFIDDGTVKFGPAPPGVTPVRPPWQIGALVGLLIAVVILAAVVIGALQPSAPGGSAGADATSAFGWSGVTTHLYLSADKTPVLLTVGTKSFWNRPADNEDVAVFNDVRDGSVIAQLSLADSAVMSMHPGGTSFDVREFSDGDIYLIAEKSLLFRVRKTGYAITDVSRSLFAGEPELANGVAKIEFLYPSDGEGFKLMTNDGRTFFYYVVRRELHADPVRAGEGYFADVRSANAELKSAVTFGPLYNSDYPDVPGRLIALHYKVDPYSQATPELAPSIGGTWDDPERLRVEGVVSQREFTPGRRYFDYGVVYVDDDYVLTSYRLTPGTAAPRYLQLLDARTAAILFTLRYDDWRSPRDAVRYADGFAFESGTSMFTLSLKGDLHQQTPAMRDGAKP